MEPTLPREPPPELERPAQGDSAFVGVLALAKQARAAVGFLTDAAFADRARQGTLIAAVEAGTVVAYVLYDLPRDEIRVVHLVVARSHRGRGLSRTLIDRVTEDHAERRGIFLHCRNDFDADRLWPKLDFQPRGERPGNSYDGKPLTRWFRSFGQPDLFTYLHEDDARPVAILDACVFYDLVAERPKPITQQLRADWIGEHARLAVTGHLLNEIHRGNDPDERRRLTAEQERFRVTPPPATAWRALLDRLRDAHPEAPAKDENDLTHAAQAMASRATWLVSTDRRFIARYAATAAAIGGLRLITPSAFLRELDELARGDRYRPVDLAGTAVTVSEVGAGDLAGLADRFVNHPERERIRDLRALIDDAAAKPGTVRLEAVTVDGEPRGLVAWQLEDEELRVSLIRASAGIGETTIGRHLLGRLRDTAAAEAIETIRITDRHPSSTVARSFRDEGFAAASSSDASDGIVAHALHGTGTLADLHDRATAVRSPLADSPMFAPGPTDLLQRAAEAERWFAPYRVLGAGIPTLVVPIQHGWATDLVDVGLAEDQLLPRPWGLGLRRELVYYRSCRNPSHLPLPARLLWYVSGTARGAGTIRAVSHLTEVAIDEHTRLYHRFRPLGVYSAEDVASRADKRTGRAMAMRFTSTHRLPRPIPLAEYRRLMTGDSYDRSVVVRSIRPTHEHVFARMLSLEAAHDH